MVFQEYALFPHMTVEDNISFGLRARKEPESEITRKVAHATEVLDLGTRAGPPTGRALGR